MDNTHFDALEFVRLSFVVVGGGNGSCIVWCCSKMF